MKTVTVQITQNFLKKNPKIRIFCVLYYRCRKKNLETLEKIQALKEYTGTLVHDHETSLYHFGTRHGECNVHLNRYLQKNTKETGNLWNNNLKQFLAGMDHASRELIREGITTFTDEQLARYGDRYDRLVAEGRGMNQKTQGKLAKQEENKLLNRLEKYKTDYLLFLHDFKVPFNNNMPEKDLRICKNREKMAGGFRTDKGRQIYYNIMSFIKTVKQKKQNIFESIKALMNGTPAIE